MNTTIAITNDFEGTALTTIQYQGRPCWIANEIGTALGYAHGGRRLIQSVTKNWRREFAPGTDYLILKGKELKDFKSLLADDTDLVSSKLEQSRRGIMLLFETGLYLVVQKTEKPAGVRLRRFLAEDVLPQIRRTGSYTPPPPQPTPMDERMIQEHLRQGRIWRITQLLEAGKGNLAGDYVRRIVETCLGNETGEAKATNPILDVSQFLADKGFGREGQRRFAGAFGKTLRRLYVEKHGEEPKKLQRYVNDHDVFVNCYTEKDRPLFEAAFLVHFGGHVEANQNVPRLLTEEVG